MDINKEELAQLAADPNLTAKAIIEKLGLNNYAALDYQMNKHPELRAVYKEGREAAAKASGKPMRSTKTTASPRAPRASSSAPPPATRVPTARAA